MSYTFLLDAAAESSAECFSDIPASVLSRLNLTAEKSCSSASEMESCQSSQSGMMLRRLTGFRGETWLTWYAGASPVRTYLPPAKELASVVNAADSGPSSPESLARFNPDLYGWKTAQCSLFGGLEWFAETWPRWGMMQDGELFPLLTPERLTLENEYGYSETDGGFGQLPACRETGGGTEKPNSRECWPTPQSHNYKEPGAGTIQRGGRRSDLTQAVKKFPTPTKRDYKDGPTPRIRGGIIQTDTLGRVVNLENQQAGGQLNPDWVEWLMGWPIGWTDLRPLEMAKFQVWLDSHGKY